MASLGYDLSTNGARPDRPMRSDAPGTVSSRRHLRNGVPDIYRRDATARRDQPPPFAMRFLHALEEVLDPVAATLDSLPAHLDVDLAPEHALAGLATWLGVDEVESLPATQRREAVRRAGELGRLRGTRAGLQLALSLFFPDITVRINDHGGVVVSESLDEQPPLTGASFDVLCEQSLPPETQMAVARCIERWKPVHARYKLRVKRGDRVKTLPDVPAVSPEEGTTPPELRPPFDDGRAADEDGER
ncbi:MAG TPA: phage tail protein [Solirubrobacteraceae bacterium]|nr:phage tail protein [Solirubrobacteraceae bacterium]HWI08750.1 phage tail protein [Solirubrobacteraceae bacterium]